MQKPSGTLVLCLAPTLVLANGAMGLGLEQWDPTIWVAYVAATVVFEAWVIGRWLKFGWPASLAVSLVANGLTGGCCGLGGLVAPFLHGSFVGSSADPSPFLNAVVLLAVFAIPSALVETLVWAAFSKRLKEPLGQPSLFARAIYAHAVGVPLGLAILLLPARPYLGMEMFANTARKFEIQRFAQDLEAYVAEHERWPQATTVEELLREVPTERDSGDRGVIFYAPEFRRFDLGEARRHPFVLDSTMAGKKVDLELDRSEPAYTWYIRPPGTPHVKGWGIQVDRRSGEVKAAVAK